MVSDPLDATREGRKKLAESLVADLSATFLRESTFWDFGNAAAGSDENFTLSDWWRVFRTVPDMRKWMCMALVWNLITPKWPKQGFSEAHIPGRKYNFKYRSFFSDLMVLEAVSRSYRHFGLAPSADFKSRTEDLIQLAWKNEFSTPYEDSTLALFAYPPPQDHGISKSDPIHKIFVESGKNVPENDSSCFIRSGILHVAEGFGVEQGYYHDSIEDTNRLIRFLGDHVRGKGRYGQKEPSYAAGVAPGEHPISVWVFDPHNEYEPFCNVNMLEYMIRVWIEQPGLDASKLCGISAGVLRYLANHAAAGDLVSPRFMHYYPLGVSLYLWWRFMESFGALSIDQQKRVDPNSCIHRIDEYLRGVADQFKLTSTAAQFLSPENQAPVPLSEFDVLLASPFLYSRHIGRKELKARIALGRDYLRPLLKTPHTLCHMLYPSKILCMPLQLPTAAFLDLINIVDKSD